VATRFVNVDRQTPMLLPPSLKEWVQRDDLVHFLIDGVEAMNVAGAVINERGTGSEQYPPNMMLALLIYCYANGIFSSRKIEKATYQHVSVRYITANHHPDHDTIAEFRRKNGALIQQAFVQLLRMSRELGVLKVGQLVIDGTKIAAATTKKQTRSYRQLQEELSQLNTQVQELMEKAAAAEQQDQSPELPAELADVQKRREKLQSALATIEEQTRKAHEEREKQRTEPKDPPGDKPRALPPKPKETATINLTDPESKLTPVAGKRFIQGYNAQLAVETQSGLIVATEVVRDTSDLQQLAPMVNKSLGNGCRAKRVIVDTGYENIRQIRAVQKQHRLKILCPPTKVANANPENLGKRPWRRMSKRFRELMRQKLKTRRGRALYALRGSTIEPIFGILKSTLGFREFRLRGLEKVRIEWTLLALAFNCNRLLRRVSAA
jgi:transposase